VPLGRSKPRSLPRPVIRGPPERAGKSNVVSGSAVHLDHTIRDTQPNTPRAATATAINCSRQTLDICVIACERRRGKEPSLIRASDVVVESPRNTATGPHIIARYRSRQLQAPVSTRSPRKAQSRAEGLLRAASGGTSRVRGSACEDSASHQAFSLRYPHSHCADA
jgi:hypothetical protein